VNMSDELKERNILKLILNMRFACATLDVGHPIRSAKDISIWPKREKPGDAKLRVYGG
jgi:hypothetical protein